MLHGNKPGQHHGEIKQNSGPPQRAEYDAPLLAQEGKRENDEHRKKRRDGPLGQRGEAGEKVNVVEPELGAGFIPGVPAEQTDGQRGGHLHICGRAARESHDAGTRHRDQRRIQMPSGPESPHVQVDKRRHDKGKGSGGKTGAPVVHTEVLKEKHGAPIIERRLLQPGTAVEIRRDAGVQASLQAVRRIEVHQHFVRDLGIAGLVGSHQAHSVAAQDGSKTIKKEKDGEGKKNGGFAEGGPARRAPAPACGLIGSRRFYGISHLCHFSTTISSGAPNSTLPLDLVSVLTQDGWG
jgi:hypothetical protein